MELVSNQRVAQALEEIAELLELNGESGFRVRAYENAARTIRHMSTDIDDLSAAGSLQSIAGVGGALASKIEELLTTGTMAYLEGLRAAFPPGVRPLMAVPGVGPKMAARVYRELNIDTIEDLEAAALDGRLAGLPRMGEKTAGNLLRAIQRSKGQDSQRTPVGQVLPYVNMLTQRLAASDIVRNLTVAGSLRRFKETIKDIDIIATSEDPSAAFDFFLTLPGIGEVIARGPTKLSILNDRGMQVDFRIVPDEAYGSLLQHFTGSAAHNVALREYALKRGQSLSEYGITDVESKERVAFTDEADFYAALDLPWIPPELREGTGELEAAIRGQLPRLVSGADIRGDLHMHTNWSDGRNTIDEMVEAAVAKGYEYIAITDHSPSRGGNPGGLTVERLSAQREALLEAQKKYPQIRILRGTEVDIRNDGSLDFGDDVLAELDWVVASIHSTFSMSRDQMTARMLAAIRNPHVDCIGHPTGRVLGRRPPYDLDLDAVFEAAAENGTAIEINSFPQRLDLKDAHVRRAIEVGVAIVIDTDAHMVAELDQIEFGIRVARRGWAEPRDIVNTRGLSDLLSFGRGER